MKKSTAVKSKAARPRRGLPEQTRERFLETGAEIFNRLGYHGTDSNEIAHQAGYATGTFYKHFKDKKELFLAVYERWIRGEWRAISEAIEAGGSSREIAKALVEVSIDFHTKGLGLRSSLQVLVASDPEVRKFYRQQRKAQLDTMARIRDEIGATSRTREEDALHLYLTERVFDAIAMGELQQLGLDRGVVVEEMVRRVEALLR